MISYYPLAKGNKWEYKMKNGNTYTNEVLEVNGNLVTMKNSTLPDPNQVKIENGIMYNELVEKGNFQPWLKDELSIGDSWDATFTANGLNSIMTLTVRETGISLDVEGKTYPDVTLVEAESKIDMNGNLISLNYFTKYYYAKGVGLVLTASSDGEAHSLTTYTIQ
ncbi:MAG: hypothetical protein IPP31_12660 [Chitinophagaceae bacterium]|nr:hypothetical protein [Chitinophagaceae bacterium]